jgi:cyclophilin family peptidyl-prolyl cis-trans isomerase
VTFARKTPFQLIARWLPLALLIALPVFGASPAAQAAGQSQVKVVTNVGSFVIELYPREAPHSVKNFLSLVDAEFYDGLVFHRVIPGFMIQTGGYDADLNLREPGANVVNESGNGLTNRKGMVAMARLNHPDSANSQFYINVADNSHLDGSRGQPGYTVFGRVIDGWRTVTQIELVDTGRRNGLAGVPEQTIKIETIRRIPPQTD